MKKMIKQFENFCKIHRKILGKILFGNIILFTAAILWHKNFKTAVLFAFFLLFNFILYSILSASTDSENTILTVKTDEMRNGIKILKMAVASMAMLSWLTTAGGLQEFVFPDENWKSLLASFAIQAILLVISLMYCQLYAWTKSTYFLSKRFGKIILYAVTILLMVSMIWSSLFSYVFLAKGIYGRRRCRDENIILEKFLVEQTTLLQEENEKYGENYRDNLQDALESVNKLIKNQQGKAKSDQENMILEYIKKELPILQAKDSAENKSSSEDIYTMRRFDDDAANQIFIDNHGQKPAELQGVKAAFNSWYCDYDTFCQAYTEKLSSVLMLLTGKSDKELIDAVVNSDWTDPFGEMGIDNIIEDIGNYQGYIYDRELSGYKDALKSELRNLNTKIKYLQTVYEKIESLVKEYKNISEDMGNGNLKLSIVASIMVGNDTSSEDVDALLEEMRSSIDLTKNDDKQSLDVESLNSLSSLITYFDKYKKYLELKAGLDDFMDMNLAKTYIIVSNSECETQTSQKQSETGYVIYIDEKQWIDIRKEDFAQFIRLLKLLPEGQQEINLNHTDDTANTDDIYNKNEKDEGIDTNNTYEREAVLNAAYTLNRDLLENITVLEEAINYFKYDFNSMAYAAAFLAIFFDLGSFLAGCLFFAMKNYKGSLPPK